MLAALLALSATAALAQPTSPPPPEVVFAALEQALQELPSARFDYGAVLAEIGSSEPEAIFTWVRDNTGFVAYRGALKGAAGVLMDREGNSLDRALLLERLLQEAGHSVALARATLGGAELQAAATAQRRAPETSRPEPDAASLVTRATELLGLDGELLAERLALAEQDQQRLARDIEGAVTAQAQAMTELIAASEPVSAALRSVAATDRSELLADHWWVQVNQGGWVDLDPTLQGAGYGEPLVQPEARFSLPEVRFLAAVDGSCRDLSCGDRLHRVQVSVVAEVWDGELLSEHELVTTEVLASDGLQQGLVFAAQPQSWPDLDPFATELPLDRLREELLATSSWQPTLFVGESGVSGPTISANGEQNDTRGGGGPAGNAGMLGGGIGGLFGGAASGSSGATDEDEGAFTALWLEYTVHTPGEGSVTERRQVFDLIGPARRAAGVSEVQLTDEQRLQRALALGGQTDIVITGAGLTPEAVTWVAASRVLADREAWSRLYHEGQSLDIAEVSARIDDTRALVPPLAQLQVMRAARLAGYGSGAFVAAYHRYFNEDLTVAGSFDLVAGGVAGLPDQDLQAVRLAQGITDTALEAELADALSEAQRAAPMRTSVSQAFSSDLAAGAAWRLVSTHAELLEVAPALAPDLLARVAAELEQGRAALVPTSGSNVGWFSLDLATGAILGRGDLGWGQAMSEYAAQTNIALQLRTALNQYAAMGRCLGLALTGPLRGLGPEDSDSELQECVFTTICGAANSALQMHFDFPVNWTNVILAGSIDALWGGAPETGFGGICGSLWKKLNG